MSRKVHAVYEGHTVQAHWPMSSYMIPLAVRVAGCMHFQEGEAFLADLQRLPDLFPDTDVPLTCRMRLERLGQGPFQVDDLVFELVRDADAGMYKKSKRLVATRGVALPEPAPRRSASAGVRMVDPRGVYRVDTNAAPLLREPLGGPLTHVQHAPVPSEDVTALRAENAALRKRVEAIENAFMEAGVPTGGVAPSGDWREAVEALTRRLDNVGPPQARKIEAAFEWVKDRNRIAEASIIDLKRKAGLMVDAIVNDKGEILNAE